MKVSALFFGCSRTFVYLCTEASRAVPERVTRQPSNGSHGGQYDAVVLTSKNSNYATAHLLHEVCPAVCRHADSRVSNRFQSSGRQYWLDWYAVCVPIMTRHLSTSFNVAALMFLPSMTVRPSLLPILSDTILPTIDWPPSAESLNFQNSALAVCSCRG